LREKNFLEPKAIIIVSSSVIEKEMIMIRLLDQAGEEGKKGGFHNFRATKENFHSSRKKEGETHALGVPMERRRKGCCLEQNREGGKELSIFALCL